MVWNWDQPGEGEEVDDGRASGRIHHGGEGRTVVDSSFSGLAKLVSSFAFALVPRRF